MKYVGSKNRLSKQIAPIIQSYIDNTPDCRGYLEPFVGGANMIDKIKAPCKIGNDIHSYLIALLNHVQQTTDDLPDAITEDEYKRVHADYSHGGGDATMIGTLGLSDSVRLVLNGLAVIQGGSKRMA